MRIIKCEMCGKEMEVKYGARKYCLDCRKVRDDELAKKHYKKVEKDMRRKENKVKK